MVLNENNHLFNVEKKDFKDIFKMYFKPLFHLSLYYLGNEEESKEVVQDAFIKLWEARSSLHSNSNLGNFLFTLVKNECLNILKRRQVLLKHHEKIRLMELEYQYKSLERVAEDFMVFNELKEKVDQAVKNLPGPCRLVFEMSRNEELKNREIAEKLGVTQKTVEAHLTKAIKLLRKNLKDYLPLIAVITDILKSIYIQNFC
jgi:RNA polymerase sigma-70 factor (ECF subfamily)